MKYCNVCIRDPNDSSRNCVGYPGCICDCHNTLSNAMKECIRIVKRNLEIYFNLDKK